MLKNTTSSSYTSDILYDSDNKIVEPYIPGLINNGSLKSPPSVPPYIPTRTNSLNSYTPTSPLPLSVSPKTNGKKIENYIIHEQHQQQQQQHNNSNSGKHKRANTSPSSLFEPDRKIKKNKQNNNDNDEVLQVKRKKGGGKTSEINSNQNNKETPNTSSSSSSLTTTINTTTTTTTSSSSLSSLNNHQDHDIITIEDDTLFLAEIPSKTSFNVNLQVPTKYYKNVMPIFNKGVRTELFVKNSKTSKNIWAHVSIKNTDEIQLPIAMYKIANIDSKIIDNLKSCMNNNIKFKENILNEKRSDKYTRVYNESGIIHIGNPNVNKNFDNDDEALYSNGRIDLKKNLTYVFELSLNIIFAKKYINIYNTQYNCSLYSRSDNHFLSCLVINVYENCIIEHGVRLMQNVN